ncbi:MAG: DUF4198 domain-containing protein [Telluria sp.]
MTNTKNILLAAVLAALSAQASAHRPWLLPALTSVDGKEPVVLIDGAVSENLFDFDHMALKMDGAMITGPDGAVSPAPAGVSQKGRSSFELKMAKPGTYKVSMASLTFNASWKEGAETRRWRGTEEAFKKEVPANAPELKSSSQHARMETFVTANKPNTGALKPSGEGLEMVPVTHPNDLHAGETAKWRFTLDGKPLANFPFSLLPAGVRHRGVLGEIRLSTDAKGEATVKLPEGGMYWMSASYPAGLGKGETPPGPNPRRYSYSATLEVLPE